MPKPSPFLLAVMATGAVLLGLGTWRYVRQGPPDADNRGFEAAAPATPGRLAPVEEPVAPALPSGEATEAPPPERSTLSIETSALPWLAGVVAGRPENARAGILEGLTRAEAAGDLNCAPRLSGLDAAALTALEEVSCIASKGDRIELRLDGDGDLGLDIRDAKDGVLSIELGDGALSVNLE